ncbi:dual specificity protein phosphatase family protein [Ancylobacter sp. 6x-1]|uniref:Dual specificity protein phosphatase family protein n=1 Tax=Ancylobacter crimeensis TaxID=2579147 RepID=A0ABT0DAR0_9HYPH|nr:dual specificity protein phosphatase family protein [Ancylobacter crimeensis]MCK0197037.1 dual specificity protein phosphatase family protein [Ancylobacter crimeensis]
MNSSDPEAGPEAPAAAALSTRRKRSWRWTLLGAVLGIGAFLGIEQLVGNFHTVVPGELYRSAQVDAADIARIKQKYGIATIINLRGYSGRPWHAEEVAASAALGINHIDIPLSAGRELTDEQAQHLIAVMRDAPKPILVHCRGGSDRSGIASALYLAAVAGRGEDAAEGQLSIWYGHFSLPYFPAWAMDETFERLEPWLGFPDS